MGCIELSSVLASAEHSSFRRYEFLVVSNQSMILCTFVPRIYCSLHTTPYFKEPFIFSLIVKLNAQYSQFSIQFKWNVNTALSI